MSLGFKGRTNLGKYVEKVLRVKGCIIYEDVRNLEVTFESAKNFFPLSELVT